MAIEVKAEPLNSKEVLELSRQHVFFSWSIQNTVKPIPVDRGEGIYFWDLDGKRYMDFSSQLMNLNIGYQHPKVVAAIQAQAAKLCAAHPNMATEPKAVLAKMVAELTPGDLNKVFFTLGGAEANENAIKFARQYTGRQKIISRYISYHGATYGAITLSGDYRRPPVEPGITGVIHAFDPYCYRCTFGYTPDKCHRECVSHIEKIIQYENPETIAAVFMEGITGSNGILVPPDDYWPRIREITQKYGILLVSDEVMSGFGRTGEWFAVDHWGVVPDIITMAKGLTSGYLPLGAVAVSQKIADYFEDRMLYMGLTYYGHPMSCAAAIATLNVYKEDLLVENCRAMGSILGEALNALQARYDCVGDVRFIGLFSAIELVEDRNTKEPMKASLMNQVKNDLLEHGLSTFINKNVVFVCPPLCITADELRSGLEIIEAAISRAG
jgi:taurine--2-oxoglutarate transaminase